MEIKVAERKGFCSGVLNAYKVVNKILKNNGKVYIYGDLVHNQEVINELNEKGAITIRGIKEIPKNSSNETIIIRAHGIPQKEKELLEKSFLKVIDMTCPIVNNLVKYAREKQKEGYFVIAFGKPEHPEMIGLKGNVDENKLLITLQPQEIKQKKILIVSQTTMEEKKFKEFFVDIINKNEFSEVLIKKTICYETILRERETNELSKQCSVMFVIGGERSSNTKKLYHISKQNCDKTFFFSSFEKLKEVDIHPSDKIGIVTGSSTPESELYNILDYLTQKEELL
jgi:4-hydroxy-3-methylbut-2-enyl diphosphate reductase